MTNQPLNLDDWLVRIRQAKDASTVYKILDEFRPLDWTDKERAEMFRIYIKVLDTLSKAAPPSGKGQKAAAAQENDGPVWYEKM
ncbi:MAG: hypothetical protein K2W82_08065 [Candidatus Obscuribacterales bacterium]|nr:hypothetical protein [Candidatus Obscuribacterales bacterium]